jgi:hypothetical protein
VPARFIAELAKSDEFRRATEYRIDTSRMLDREFVNRFVAFYINEPASYAPDLDSFLNDSMAKLSSLTNAELSKIKQDFQASMRLAHEIFGIWAFRKADLYPTRRKPINKALFEVWSVCLAKLDDKERAIIKTRKDEVMAALVGLLKEYGPFWEAVTAATGDKKRIVYRFDTIRNLLRELLK